MRVAASPTGPLSLLDWLPYLWKRVAFPAAPPADARIRWQSLAVVLVLAASASSQLRCADGARVGARAAALGESAATVSATAARVAGAGARVVLEREGGWITVTVSRPVASGPFGGAPLRAAASAIALVEP